VPWWLVGGWKWLPACLGACALELVPWWLVGWWLAATCVPWSLCLGWCAWWLAVTCVP